MTGAKVCAVACDAAHGFSKSMVPHITLIAGLGVAGDAHAGTTVQHRSRVAINPHAPNLRQVHLVHSELLDDLREQGFILTPGQIGENILTRGLDLLALPTGTRLHIGTAAVIEITGLRNPCAQLDNFQPGLTKAVLGRGPTGAIIRKAGVMAIVISNGEVTPGDAIRVMLPPAPHIPLIPV